MIDPLALVHAFYCCHSWTQLLRMNSRSMWLSTRTRIGHHYHMFARNTDVHQHHICSMFHAFNTRIRNLVIVMPTYKKILSHANCIAGVVPYWTMDNQMGDSREEIFICEMGYLMRFDVLHVAESHGPVPCVFEKYGSNPSLDS